MRKSMLIALLLAFATPAVALEINFGAVLNDQDGDPIDDCAKTTEQPPPAPPRCVKHVTLTLGRAAFVALMTPQTDEQGAPPDEKKRKGDLALRAYLNQPTDLSIEEVAMIKKAIAKAYPPLIIARAFPLLDLTK